MNEGKMRLEPAVDSDGKAAVGVTVRDGDTVKASFLIRDRDLTTFKTSLTATMQQARALIVPLPANVVRLDPAKRRERPEGCEWMRLRNTERPRLTLEAR